MFAPPNTLNVPDRTKDEADWRVRSDRLAGKSTDGCPACRSDRVLPGPFYDRLLRRCLDCGRTSRGAR
jgi:hypothetical protein